MKTLRLADRAGVGVLLVAGCLATAMGQTVTVTSPDGTVTYNNAHPITLTAPVAGVATPVNVRITSSPAAVVTVALNMNTPIPFLYINQTNGQTPLDVAISQLQSGVVAQTYNGSLNVSIGGTQVATVPVVLTIGGGTGGGGGGGTGGLFVIPSSLTFTQTGSAVPLPQAVTVTGAFPGSSIIATVTSGATWLQASPVGTVGGIGSNLLVSVSTAGLGTSAATYTGNVHVLAGGQTADLPVTLVINGGSTGGGGGGGTTTGQVTANPAALSFTYQPNASNNQTSQNVTLSLSSGDVYGYTLAVSPAASWLSLSTTGGTILANTPTNLTVTVSPASLQNGTYQTEIQVLPFAGGTTPAQRIPVTLTVGNSSNVGTLQTDAVPFGILFNLPKSQSGPVTQQLLVTTTGSTPITYGASLTGLTCDPSNTAPQVSIDGTGTTGTPINVTVTPAGLVTGRVDCTATITVAGGTGSPLTIPLRISQSTTPVLNICTTNQAGGYCAAPQRLKLTVVQGQTTNTTLYVTSSDPTFTAYFTASANPGGQWLTLGSAQPTNTISTTTPYPLQINVNAAGLTPGSYEGSVKFTSNNPANGLPTGEWTIPLTVTVTSTGGGGGTPVTANPASVSLNSTFGSTTALTQTVVLNAGGAILPYSATIAYTNPSDPAWLTMSTSAQGPFGTTLTGSTGTQNSIYLNAQPASLPAGEHKATITVNVTGGTTVTIPVSLVVAPQLTLSTQSLTFSGQAGSATNPVNQTFTISSAAGQVPFTTQVNATSCGGAWLSASPQSGNASPGTPATVTVSVTGLSGLQTGSCTGTITVSSTGLPAQTVNVTLNVTAPPAPHVTKIVSAATFLPGAISPGEIIAVGGSNLGPATQQDITLVNNMFPTAVAGTRVLFDGIPGAITYLGPVPGDATLNQINVIVPYEIAGRAQVSIQVERNGVQSDAIVQSVAATAPALFLGNATDVAMYNNTKGNYVTPQTPASIGDIVTFYGTGEGVVNPLPATGSVTSTNLANVGQIVAPYSVRLGGVALSPSDVQYVGPAPGLAAGVFQVNIKVPSFIKDTKVPVSVAIGAGGDSAPQGTGYMYVQP